METLVEQSAPEKQKSFDIMASVEMFKYDLTTFGCVLPETRERVCDEELSLIVEGIDRAACTSFVLKRDQDGNLIYFNRGRWTPYISTLITGQQVAEREARQDPRRRFLARNTTEDLANGYRIAGLEPGQKHAWYSSYPHEEADTFGETFMESCGLKPSRKMGFLYMATGQEDGSVLLETQSVDLSDPDAFDAVMEMLDYDDEADIEAMTRTYDGALYKKHGQHFYAGRTDSELNENAWQAIQQHRSLIEYHINELERMASLDLPEHDLAKLVKKHTYGVWAAFKKRLEGETTVSQSGFARPVLTLAGVSLPPEMSIRQEVNFAFRDFVDRGEVMTGCGGSIRMEFGLGEKDVLNLSVGDVFGSIFGQSRGSGRSKKESYSFDKSMFCVVCQAPPKKEEKKKMCGPCGLCKSCDKKAATAPKLLVTV